METLTLVIGNRNYSSWSLRAWLALDHAGASCQEVVVRLGEPDARQAKVGHSPTGRVPILRHGDLVIWESLAICEHVAELFPQARLWPDDMLVRAIARSVSAEMHAGFAALRKALPMNVRATIPGVTVGSEAREDIERVLALWADCRSRFGGGGPYLFGRFSIADVMYAPVALRFRTYGVGLDKTATAWCEAIYSLPAVQRWVALAKEEPWVIAGLELTPGREGER